MGILKKLSKLFGGSTQPEANETWAYVRCNRCHEAIRARIDMFNHLSIEFGEDEKDVSYICRKRLMGDGANRCFQAIDIELVFDDHRKLVHQEIQGGSFINAEQYEAERMVS